MMKGILFYLIYPFLYFIASLPFSILYIISDFLFLVLYYSGYRKKVVKANLQNSFPDKSKKEIKIITRDFYHYLCDLILETVKTIKITEQEISKRCTIKDTALFEKLYSENKSILMVMGHFGNWEWAGPAFAIKRLHPLHVIYRPLSNEYFEKMMSGMRTRFGTKIVPVNLTLREMISNQNKLTCTAFIADQTPSHGQVYWTNFLHQDTPVFTGPEKLGKKFNYPVLYISVKKIKRGFYEIDAELLNENPASTGENEITESFIRRLEKDIQHHPSIWLWSHRRWKHKRNIN